ncbi:MAG: lipocalin-like domain-containing protein [Candidatus Levyibacteriota bacterium]
MPDAKSPLSEQLPGTWELLSRVDLSSMGEPRIEPSLGADPIAMLIYDRSGHFAAQFMKRDRSSVRTNETRAVEANNSRAVGGYDAYFGDYEVDDATNVVTQRLRGALSPESVGMVVSREMKVDNGTLSISLQTTIAGEPVTRTLTWKRVG